MSSETEVLSALFAAAMSVEAEDAPAREALWRGFLDLLATQNQAESALLHIAWSGAAPSRWQVGADWGVPQASTIERMRSHRVYSQIDLPAPVAPARPLRAVKWRIGAEGVAALVLQRDRGDFRAVSAVQMSNLLPHLALALKGWRQLERARAEAALDQRLARALGTGWVVFSPSGQIKRMAPNMAARLARGGENPQAVQQGVAAALRMGTPQVVDLSSAPVVQMRLTPENLAGEAVVVGRLRQDLSARALALDLLVARFGLSRSEARLAACLCDGLSLQRAAQDLGWTRETTRSYAKQVYAKLGVSGQSGVVRLLLLDALWLGPVADHA